MKLYFLLLLVVCLVGCGNPQQGVVVAPSVPRPSEPTATEAVGAGVAPTANETATTVAAPSTTTESAAPTAASDNPTIAPSETSLPPTATTVPPSATAIPPTATSVPTAPAAPRTVGAAVVTAITDGDTVTVEIDGVEYTVRYIGMDTPERGDPFFSEATQANSNLVLGKEVWLEKDVNETDRFGRLLRYVFLGDVLVNEELVRTGYAQASAYPPDVKYQDRLDEAERVARANSAGLWAIAVAPTTAPPPPATAPPAPPPAGPTATLPPAPTGSGLVITFVDKRDEYVDIRNDSGSQIDLGGWILRSEKGSQDCGLGGIIGAGEALRIWAQAGSPGLSCNFGGPIWNNSENDDALLIDPQGREAYRYDS